MNATYRIQLRPGLGFDELRELLPYFRRLGISHLYLSPISEARAESAHGYDVVDHNQVRVEFGGPEAFDRLLESAQAVGLAFILDFVPNHEGVGAQNARWQDVLMFGPHSPYARYFDIDWDPLKPELRQKILLPFLGRPYGEVLDRGEIALVYEGERFYAAYHQHRFPLTPPTYEQVLEFLLAAGPSVRGGVHELRTVCDAYRTLAPDDRGNAEGLRLRLASVVDQVEIGDLLLRVRGEQLHAILERQYWRLSYWKTAPQEVNYRRFFDNNDLVALRMEEPEVFRDVHRLLGQYVTRAAVMGVRIDHIDGLLDPATYLQRLRELGARHVWVEKVLARGETLPPQWPVEGTTGYEFLNDALGVLLWPDGEHPMDRIYRRFLRGIVVPYWVEMYRCKRLVMETTLAGELFRLAYGLDRISEADYHTRDFTFEALRIALAEVIAAFGRYRTYLPERADEAEQVVREAVHEARRRNPGRELTVYAFIEQVLLGSVGEHVKAIAAPWVGRFQQYTAPVTAKGIEDTAFYRHFRLIALNEVGGGPDRWSTTLHAFHARARFRAVRYPMSLLATATHDHKRGEDTRMRLIVLAEMPDAWQRTLRALTRVARRYRSPAGPSRADEYHFYQVLVALWDGEDPDALAPRLLRYMQKGAREAKLRTSWLDPDLEYEAALERFVRGVLGDPRLPQAVEPLARALARHGFANGLSQLLMKLTSPGVPDFYQGCELLDLSLVDPDNRRPVDFAKRMRLLEDVEPLLEAPDPVRVREMIEGGEERVKLFVMVRLLRFRQAHPEVFVGNYWPLESDGPAAAHLAAYALESNGEALIVLVPRFPAVGEQRDGWEDTVVLLGERLANRRWTDVITGATLQPGARLGATALPLRWATLFSPAEPAAGGGPPLMPPIDVPHELRSAGTGVREVAGCRPPRIMLGGTPGSIRR
jgi:(1->4)-alpha-D-glucan 1-alpha-D-glucosylmutase